MLIDCEASDDDMLKCHYSAAVGADGRLYVIATADYAGEARNGRGAVLFTVDLKKL